MSEPGFRDEFCRWWSTMVPSRGALGWLLAGIVAGIVWAFG